MEVLVSMMMNVSPLLLTFAIPTKKSSDGEMIEVVVMVVVGGAGRCNADGSWWDGKVQSWWWIW